MRLRNHPAPIGSPSGTWPSPMCLSSRRAHAIDLINWKQLPGDRGVSITSEPDDRIGGAPKLQSSGRLGILRSKEARCAAAPRK